MSFLPLPPASHLLEINIECICGKVAIDEAVNGWEKPGRALWASLLAFLCGHKRSLPRARSSPSVRCLLSTICPRSSLSAPHKVHAHPGLPGGVWLYGRPPSLRRGTPTPALGLGWLAFKAKPRLKPGITQVSKLCPRSPRQGAMLGPCWHLPPSPRGHSLPLHAPAPPSDSSSTSASVSKAP